MRLAALLAFTCNVAIASFASASCTLEAISVIPTLPFAGYEIVAADINARRANLIVDTGASSTNIKISAASRLGVSLHPRDPANQGIGGNERTWRGYAGTLRLSQLVLHNQAVGGTLAQTDPQIDGLLGMDILTSYDIDIDFTGRHIILFEPAGSCSTPTVAIAAPLYSAPLVYIRNDALAEVSVLVEGKPIRALIDSGSPTTAIFRRAAARLDIDLTRFNAPQHHESRGVGPRPIRTFTQTLPSITIGTLTLPGVQAEILDQAGFGIDRIYTGSRLPDDDDGRAGGEQMILGADILQRVHVWISHSSHRLIMQYPPKASAVPK